MGLTVVLMEVPQVDQEALHNGMALKTSNLED